MARVPPRLQEADLWPCQPHRALFGRRDERCPQIERLGSRSRHPRDGRAIQRFHPSLQLRYVLPTFYDRRVRKSLEIQELLAAHYGQQICSPVRYNVRLSEAPGYGQTIYEYAPRSPGAEDYWNLTERIMQDGRTQTNT